MTFETVSKQLIKDFYSENWINHKEVLRFLGLRRKDIAVPLGIAIDSVRFDSRMSEKQKLLIEQIVNLIELVAEVFNGDLVKTKCWFITKNYNLGNASPLALIRLGRIDKLHHFIISAKRT